MSQPDLVPQVQVLLEGALAWLGDALGLFRALADLGRASAEALRERTGLSERQVEGWLRAMIDAGRVELEAGTYRAVHERSAVRTVAAPWLEGSAPRGWLPTDLVARLDEGVSALVLGLGRELAHLERAFPAARFVRAGVAPSRAHHDLALVVHELGAAADPVALLTSVRNALAPDGVCLVVEHVESAGLSPASRNLARLLTLAAALRSLSEPPREDLHRVGVAPSAPLDQRLARLGRAAGFATTELLPLEDPLVLFRLER